MASDSEQRGGGESRVTAMRRTRRSASERESKKGELVSAPLEFYSRQEPGAMARMVVRTEGDGKNGSGCCLNVGRAV
jgi:hypothetical protein